MQVLLILDLRIQMYLSISLTLLQHYFHLTEKYIKLSYCMLYVTFFTKLNANSKKVVCKVFFL